MSRGLQGASQVLRDWLDCSRCGLCESAHSHVLGRGQLPADVVFLGEGPGESEDAFGEAFIGPAGRILSKAIGSTTARLCFTNLVACRPCTDGKNRPPSQSEIEACRPRLLQTLREAQHGGIVLCGRLPEAAYMDLMAEDLVPSEDEIQPLYISHPAYILRNGGEKSDKFPEYSRKIRDYIRRVQNARV